MKKLILVVLCLVACINLVAQTISGMLVDDKQQPLPYANVVLHTSDSVFVTGASSGEKGEFKLQKIAAGNYRLIVSCMGYQTLYLDLQGFERPANVGTLTLSDASQQLGEVTVTASNMVSSVDRKMVFPNKKQISASSNGVDLLRNLMLPRLSINAIDGSVGMNDGSSVQFCINERKATKEEVTALLPDEIIRIEFIEDPGLRYGDAGAVVNYIVKRYATGGSVGYDGSQSLQTLFGNHNLTGKVNYKNSEFSFYYGNRLQYFNEIWSVMNETFTFDDNSQYHRVQQIDPTKKRNIQQWGALTYNLQNKDKYMLNATVGFSHFNDPDMRQNGKLYTEEYPSSVTQRNEWSHSRNLIPYFDLYFQKNLKHKQFLALNVVGTYINTKNRSSYTELLDTEPVVDFYSGVRGKKYSLITEGIYEKAFNNGGRLSSGIRHTQGYADNEYAGTLLFNTQMKQADTYAYAQYRGKWSKLGYRFGLGVTRSWFQQTGQEEYETYSLNPRLNLTYTFNEQWSMSLDGNVSTINPSLSQLSAVDQLTDSLQLDRGNPNLEAYSYYRSALRLNYSKNKWNVGLRNQFDYRDNAIMQYIYREDNKFVHSYANHPGFQTWTVGVDARVGMLWDMVQLSGGISSVKYWSRGVNFRHSQHNIGWELGATFMYKNFSASAMYKKNNDYLFGESLSTGEEVHMINVQYRLKRLNLGLRMFNPFQKDYKRLEENWNKDAGYSSRYHIDDVARMVCLTLSWNFSFGRDYKSNDKKMQNSDTDSGVM